MIKPVTDPPHDAVRAQLERLLLSAAFRDSQRSSRLLRFLVEETLAGRSHRLKEFTLGADALERGPSFDPRTDPIARVEASRLRGRLESYFAKEGAAEPIVIVLPKGSYVPQFAHRESAGRPPVPPLSTRPWPYVVAGALGGAIATIAIVLALRERMADESPAVARAAKQLEIELEADSGVLGSEVGPDIALSRDGRQLVFVSLQQDGSARLYTRALGELRAHELPGTFGARGPFISPDSRWVAFWAGGQLRKTRLDGTGSPAVICEAQDLLGGSWGEDGVIVAALSAHELSRIKVDDGSRSVLPANATQSSYLRWPQVLRHGELVLFTEVRGPVNESSIEVLDTRTGARRTLVRAGTYGRYLPGGYVAYVNRGTLFALAFDLRSLETHGAPAPVLQDVAYSPTFGYAQLDFAEDGTFVYRRAASASLVPQWLDDTGGTRAIIATPGSYQWLKLSPDNQHVAFALQEAGNYDLWIGDIAHGTKTRVVEGALDVQSPVWTPDGRLILYGVGGGIDWLAVEGSRHGHLLAPGGKEVTVPWSVTPDGRRLAYYSMSAKTGFDLWSVPFEVTSGNAHVGTPEPFLATRAFEVYPAFSPDGHWLAYGSNESGSWEVYVRAFPDDGREVRVSQGGGRIPAWSRTARELFYETDDHRVMVAHYSVNRGELRPETPQPWSARSLADTGVIANFDVAADGRRLAALMPAAEGSARRNRVVLVTDFFDEVRRRVSAAQPSKSPAEGRP